MWSGTILFVVSEMAINKNRRLSVASWNVLAERFVLEDRYAYAGAVMEPKLRRALIKVNVAELISNFDVVVLCEMEEDLAAEISESTPEASFFGGGGTGVLLISKLGGDFTSMAMFGRRVAWVDVPSPSGTVRVVGVHLRWDKDGTISRSSWGMLERKIVTPRSVIAGDINISFERIGAGEQWGAYWLENSAYVDGNWVNVDVISSNFGTVSGVSTGYEAFEPIPNGSWPSDHRALGAEITYDD